MKQILLTYLILFYTLISLGQTREDILNDLGLPLSAIENTVNQVDSDPLSIKVDDIGESNEEVEELIRDFFLQGSCIEVRNIRSKSLSDSEGNLVQIGKFKETQDLDIGIDEGIILSSGRVRQAGNSSNLTSSFNLNQSGDPLIPDSNDAAYIEFEFKPTSETISFNYVFASEEYPAFVCQQFNDQFRFMIRKINSADPLENIALIPGSTNEVSINTINDQFRPNQTCPIADYSQYYIENNGQAAHVYNGFTTRLEAQATDLDVCEWYYIKLLIADVGDGLVDSAVFLEANSFTDNSEVVIEGNSFQTSNGVDGIEEGCGDGFFVLERTDALPVSNQIVIEIEVSGTATEGVDFEELNDTYIIPPFTEQITIPIIPIFDFDVEGSETIRITAKNISCGCTDAFIFGEIDILDFTEEPIEVNDFLCTGSTYNLADGTVVDQEGQYIVIGPRTTNPNCSSYFIYNLTEVTGPVVQDLSIVPFECNETGFIDLTSYVPQFFQANTNGYSINYFTDINDPTTEISSPENVQISDDVVIYAVVQVMGGDECSAIAALSFFIEETPVNIDTSLSQCVVEIDSNDEFDFDLNELVELIQDGNTFINVTFHESLPDADASISGGLNAIGLNYTSSATSTIYSRAELVTGNSFCHSVAEVTLNVNERPTSIMANFETCKRNDEELTLSFENMNIVPSQDESLSLYPTLTDAENNTNEISLPADLSTDLYFIKSTLLDDSTCYSIGQLEVTINTSTQIQNEILSACEINGLGEFDLNALKDRIELQQPNLSISFVINTTDPTPLNSPYSSDNANVFIKSTDLQTGCISFSDLELRVFRQEGIEIEDVIYCEGSEYQLKDGRMVFKSGTYTGSYLNTQAGCDYEFVTNLIPSFGLFPNAFSPNSDGMNDVFTLVQADDCDLDISDFELTIYNRWGEKVFFTTDHITGWNGQSNQTNNPQDVFVWTAQYTIAEQNFKPSGTVVLIR